MLVCCISVCCQTSNGSHLSTHKIMEVLQVSGLCHKGKTLYTAGVMLLTHNDGKQPNLPLIILPHWNDEKEEFESLEILGKQIKSISKGRNVISLDVSLKKKKITNIIIILKGKLEILKFMKLSPMILPKTKQPKDMDPITLYKLLYISNDLHLIEGGGIRKDEEILRQIRSDLMQFGKFTEASAEKWIEFVVKGIQYPDERGILEDAELVEQYLFLLSSNNFDLRRKDFKDLLEVGKENMPAFLKSHTNITSTKIFKMLSNYVKTHKCDGEDCPEFSIFKCSKCFFYFCNEGCQKSDRNHEDCGSTEYLKTLQVSKSRKFSKWITNTVSSRLGVESLFSFEDFLSILKPRVFAAFYNFLVAETFFLGTVKYSDLDEFSDIDIREDSRSLEGLLRHDTGEQSFSANNLMWSKIIKSFGEASFFYDLALMKKYYLEGKMNPQETKSKYCSEEYLEITDWITSEFRGESFQLGSARINGSVIEYFVEKSTIVNLRCDKIYRPDQGKCPCC